MICPNCRSEVGNQPICPYCGKSIPIQRGQSGAPFNPQVVAPAPQGPEGYPAGKQSLSAAIRRMRKQLALVDLRSKLTLVLAVGTFVMQIILLIVLAGK